MKQIMTAGYGNLASEEFVALLKEAGVTLVVDIRRKGCKSWNGRYRQGPGMKGLLGLRGIEYIDRSDLGNEYKTLPEYADWLAGIYGKQQIEWMAPLVAAAEGLGHICLICSEGKPFEADGTPRCHRVLVGNALVKELGEEWSVKHL